LASFLFCMPFFLANNSHFVGGLGFGRGFSRGRRDVGAGSWMKTPSMDRFRGSARSWSTRSCVVSRETAWIWDSEGVFEGSGLGSNAARLPRSKVTGIAFVIVSAESSIADIVCCVNQVDPSDKQEE